MLSRLQLVLLTNFSKWSKPKPLAVKIKQFKAAKALGDQKAAKLSKSQLENQAKRKKAEDERIQKLSKINVERVRNHSVELEQYISPYQIKKMHNAQLVRLRGILPKKLKVPEPPRKDPNPFKTPKQTIMVQQENEEVISTKIKPIYDNYTQLINNQFSLKPITPSLETRRCGTLGKKLGMTTLWDQWGKMIPLTVIELDRVQVIRVRSPQGSEKYWNVQVGLGQANLKRISKALLGHFIKHDIPPKRNVAEFRVTEDGLLPQGYMIGARHFTPGMFVDVIGKTVGHGFSGTIKRYRFRRQPASHGNSKTTRVLGSTGGRQDPGRVFKQKKMYGHMGGKLTFQSSLKVFKIDTDRNLLYLYGSVPGKAGTIIKIRDTTLIANHEKNMEIGSYPTFIEQQGEVYARQFIMNSGERDQDEIQFHDNTFILDDKEEDPNAIAVGIQIQTTANMTLPEE